MSGAPDSSVGVLPIGTIFHQHYEVLSCIKAGGMGAVYQVLDHRTRRRRALKLMLPSIVADPEMRGRFKLEATVASEIDSEHIVETFDAGVDPETGTPFLVMELLKGEDLAAVLEHRRALPPHDVLVLMYQAALALDRTHAAGVVHRDLKPENLFVTSRDDGSPRLKVLDFGVAKVVAQSSAAKTTRSLGTPLYMSPEQITGQRQIGPRADLYSLGHITFTLLTGEAYFEREASSLDGLFPFFKRVLDGPREPASRRAQERSIALPPAFDAWFARATALDPAHRFPTAPEMVDALAQAFALPLPAPVSNPSHASFARSGASASGPHRAPFPSSGDGQPSNPMERAAVGGGSAPRTPHVTPTAFAPGMAPSSARLVITGPDAPAVARSGFSGQTTSPVSSTQPHVPVATDRVAPPARSAAPLIVAACVAAVALLGLGSAGVVYAFRHRAPAAPSDAPAAATAAAIVEPTATAPTTPQAIPSASAILTVTAPLDAGAAARPQAHAATTAPAAVPRAPKPAQTAPPTATLGAQAKPSCDPPYFIDQTGRQIFKRECVQ